MTTDAEILKNAERIVASCNPDVLPHMIALADLVLRQNAELSTLREKARLYDEAVAVPDGPWSEVVATLESYGCHVSLVEDIKCALAKTGAVPDGWQQITKQALPPIGEPCLFHVPLKAYPGFVVAGYVDSHSLDDDIIDLCGDSHRFELGCAEKWMPMPPLREPK